MADFDFITNSELRQCLESDHRELDLALNARANKAVIVLAGSLVEAMLVDYLLAYGPNGKGAKDPLRMDLWEVIDLCGKLGVLTQKDRDLCSAVRGYRNLIHPGVQTRQGEVVSEHAATVAAGVVKIVAEDVAKAFSTRRGLTCEQLVTKIESDPKNALQIMQHLVSSFRGRDLERLIVEVLPARYRLVCESEPPGEQPILLTRAYRGCFALGFDRAPALVKKKVARNVLNVIREGTARLSQVATRSSSQANA